MADYDVAIIGGGPGGYVAAIRAAQLGLRAVVFERERVGGLCLNWGCIPSKALLRNADVVNFVRDAERWGVKADNVSFDFASAIHRSREVVDKIVSGVEGLLRDNGVDVVIGSASLADAHTVACNDKTYSAGNIIVATGASSRPLPGAEIDGTTIITSRDALARTELPKRAVIIGAGPVGVEFAHLWASYGTEVTIVELLETLVPLEDTDLGRQLKRSFDARGITSHLKTKVESVAVERDVAKVTISADGETQALEADCVLVAIGFVPHTDGLGLEKAGVELQRGFVAIDERMQTNVAGIYAIGDVTGKLMLAHVASAQGVTAAEAIAGRKTPVLDYIQMPRATFSQPQVGSIGYTEKQAREAGYQVKTGRFPLAALGKAVAIAETEGFVKIVADEPTGQVLGMHLIGHDVNDLLGEATLSALLEATTVEVGFAVHAHPTLAEAVKEAALAVNGEAIHVARRRAGPAARTQGVATR